MSARIHATGISASPRKTFETPLFLHQEWPEHVARCCAAIRRRRLDESSFRPAPRAMGSQRRSRRDPKGLGRRQEPGDAPQGAAGAQRTQP